MTTLRGWKVRMITGTIVVAMGILEIVMASILIGVPSHGFHCDDLDYVSWGIWVGVLAIVTGCFGVGSKKSKCMVITYLILAMVTGLCSVGGSIFAGFQVPCAFDDLNYLRYFYGSLGQTRLHAALYIILCVIFAFQMLTLIIGASFTCIAICPEDNTQSPHVIVFQTGEGRPGETKAIREDYGRW